MADIRLLFKVELALKGSTRRSRGINFIDAATGEVLDRVGVGGENPENF